MRGTEFGLCRQYVDIDDNQEYLEEFVDQEKIKTLFTFGVPNRHAGNTIILSHPDKQKVLEYNYFTTEKPYNITTELKHLRYYYVRYYEKTKFTNVWALDFKKNYNIEIFKLNQNETKQIKYDGIINTYLVFQGECEMNNVLLTTEKFYRKVKKEDIILKATKDNTFVAKLSQVF
jgi:hypothetical protein